MNITYCSNYYLCHVYLDRNCLDIVQDWLKSSSVKKICLYPLVKTEGHLWIHYKCKCFLRNLFPEERPLLHHWICSHQYLLLSRWLHQTWQSPVPHHPAAPLSRSQTCPALGWFKSCYTMAHTHSWAQRRVWSYLIQSVH